MCSSELYIGHNYIQDIIKYIQDIIIYRTELYIGHNYIQDIIIYRTELYIGQNYIQDRILKVGLHILYTRTRNTSLTINNIEINKIIPLLLLIVNLRHIYLVLTSNKCFTNLFLFILLYPEPVKMLVSCGVPQFVRCVRSVNTVQKSMKRGGQAAPCINGSHGSSSPSQTQFSIL